MTVYLPLSGQISRYSGAGLGNDGQTLRTLPVTNNNPARYVRHGVDSPEDSSFWANATILAGGANDWFYVTHEQFTISPTGTIELKFRGSASTGSFTLGETILWARKEVNAGLSDSVIVASGLSDATISGGSATNYVINMKIIEENRAAFESGIPFYPTLSGHLTFGGATVSSGVYRAQEMNLNASGSIPSINNNITLFIQGIASSSGQMTLHTLNSVALSGDITLFIGGDPNSGVFPLYIGGDPNSGVVPLFIHGSSSGSMPMDLYVGGAFYAQSGIDLYIGGLITLSGTIPLFIKGPIGIPKSGNTPLFIWSSTNSGIFKTMDLVVWNQLQFAPQQLMPIVLFGPNSISTTSSMNLFLGNTVPSVGSGLSLFLSNQYTQSTGTMPLYMRGPVGTEGAVPFSGSMPLFIARSAEGLAGQTPLYLHVADIASGTIPLYIAGAFLNNSSIPLFIHGISSINNNSNIKQFFVSGF